MRIRYWSKKPQPGEETVERQANQITWFTEEESLHVSAQLVHELLERQAAVRPHASLVLQQESRWTYIDIDRRANGVAHRLVDQGLRRGDRVGLLATNSADYVAAYYGILKAAGVVVSLNVANGPANWCDLLTLCQARGVVCGRGMGPRAAGLEDVVSLQFIAGQTAEWNDRLAGKSGCRFGGQFDECVREDTPPLVAVTPQDRAAIVYTSGSTGRPKGATLSHANLVANTNAITSYLQLTPYDRVMVVLPFPYVYGKSLLNTHVAVGGSIVIENGFLFPQRALDTLELTECTGFSGVPSTFAILLNRSNFAVREWPHLRYITQAGGAMAPALQQQLLEALPGKQVFIMYGATEASARLTYLPLHDMPNKMGSIGQAIPGVTVRVLRDDDTQASANEVGELVAQGDNIMEGYWDDPDGTDEVLDQNGYHTGDLAKCDEDGYLYIVGRQREMIKSGAHRVAPKEIEEILQEFPQVCEAAVIGIPDPMLGEMIAAFVSSDPQQELKEQDLINWCRKRLPSHKVPGVLKVIEDFERNAAGKIDKLASRRSWATSIDHRDVSPQRALTLTLNHTHTLNPFSGHRLRGEHLKQGDILTRAYPSNQRSCPGT